MTNQVSRGKEGQMEKLNIVVNLAPKLAERIENDL
jgi:hypothetical protein